MYIERKDAVRRIRTALKKKTGKTWSVTGGRGTAWSWLCVQAPKKRRVSHKENPAWDWTDHWTTESPYIEYVREDGPNYYTSDEDAKELARAFGLIDREKVHFQGLQISPDEWEFYVERAEA